MQFVLLISQFKIVLWSIHYVSVLHILRYPKGTLFHRIHFSSTSPFIPHAYTNVEVRTTQEILPIDVYYWVLFFAWRFTHLMAQQEADCIESKYMLHTTTTFELLWLARMASSRHGVFLVFCHSCLLQILECNTNANNDIFHQQTKYININCHFVRRYFVQTTLQL